MYVIIDCAWNRQYYPHRIGEAYNALDLIPSFAVVRFGKQYQDTVMRIFK